jgi:hypothetical protein
MLSRRRSWLAERRAKGLGYPGGKPHQPFSQTGRERIVRQMKQLVSAFPPPPEAKAIDQWSHSELLLEASRLGGLRIIDILSMKLPKLADHLDDPNIVKWARLQLDAGGKALQLLASVQESAMRQASDDKWAEIAERVEAEKRKIKQMQEDRKKQREAEKNS